MNYPRDGGVDVEHELVVLSSSCLWQGCTDRCTYQTICVPRVSSADQKEDLGRQIARLVACTSERDWAVTRAVSEIGSGLNGHRPKLLRLLSDPKVGTIVVEHRDRLMRFGFEYVEAALAAQGRRIVVVEPGEVKDDLVQDRIEVLTSFCACLYGRRSAWNKAKKALEAIEHEG